MKQYHNLLKEILEKGNQKEDRTGTGTISLFGKQMRFNLEDGFPLLTTKKVYWKGVLHELLWFLKGDTNVKYLQENNVNIWNEWCGEDGDLGPVYGKQWRSWTNQHGHNDIDQIKEVIDSIKNNPDSRRHIVSAWNVSELPYMKLMPCHSLFQFYVVDGKLSCQLYQRSADMFLGIPFNIASYSLLTHMIAHVCNLKVGDFIHTIGDAHIYLNHVNQVKELLSRNERMLPSLALNSNIRNIDDFKELDVLLLNYNPHPTIKAPVAV